MTKYRRQFPGKRIILSPKLKTFAKVQIKIDTCKFICTKIQFFSINIKIKKMKTVTTYTKDLLTLSVGEVIKVPMRKYVGYTTTASLLKKDGKGSWTSHKIDKKYFTMLRQS